MQELALGMVVLAIQLTFIWSVHNQVASETKRNYSWWLGSFVISFASAAFINSYWWVTLFPFFFVYESRKERFITRSLIIFIAIYSVFIPLLLINCVTLFLYSLSAFLAINTDEIVWIAISVLGAAILYFGIVYFMKIDFSIVKKSDSFVKKRILFPSNVALLSGLVIFLFFYSLEKSKLWDHPINGYTKYIFFIYYFLFISFMLFLSIQAKNYLQQSLQIVKEEQYKQLNEYTQEIEQLYQQIRGFRHDFGNILISLGESINTEDITKIRHTYNEILVKANTDLNKSGYEIAELSNISNPAVKSVLSSKVMLAEQKNIQITLEVKNRIPFFIIETLDYVRILSILLDNAIEAAEASETKKIGIAIFVDHAQLVTIIFNSRKEEDSLTVEKLFDLHFTTKGYEHGLGLYNVQKILEKYDHATINTQIEPCALTHTLIFGERSS